MKKIYSMLILAGVASGLSAQNMVDAVRFSQSDIAGTARYRSMAGAFGALGGDISAMTDNPAGMGIYRGTCEISFTPSLRFAHAHNMGDRQMDDKKADFSIGNLGYVVSFRTPDAEHLVNFNLGLGFNHNEGVNRRYRSFVSNPRSSFGSYLANRANNALMVTGKYSYPSYLSQDAAWDDSSYPISVLAAYDCYAIDDAGYLTNPNDPNSFVNTGGVDSYDQIYGLPAFQRMLVEEATRNDEYNISGSFNWEDFIYAGFTLSISDYNSIINTQVDEDYDESLNGDYTQFLNDLESKGSGINLKWGLLIKPMDTWRIGFAVHSPTWFKMTDYYSGQMITNDERCKDYSGGHTYEYKYKFNTPWEYQVSSAWVFGKKGLLSVEYDMKDYGTMKYRSSNDSRNWDDEFENINSCMKDFATLQHTVKVGGEYRVTDKFSIRAGYAYKSSPYKEEIKDGNITRGWNNGNYGDDNTLLFDSSTKPNYCIQADQQYYTAGMGWRGNGWYIDLSMVNRIQNEQTALFPTTDAVKEIDGSGYVTMTSDAGYGAVRADHIDMKTRTLNWDLTVGFKF